MSKKPTHFAVEDITFYGMDEDNEIITNDKGEEVKKHVREQCVIKANSLDEATEIHNDGGADYKEVHCFDEEITDEGTDENKND